MRGATLVASLLVLWMSTENGRSVGAMPRPKDFRSGAAGSGAGAGAAEVASGKYDSGMNPEPSCEELKAMWRFSKRQSRAAEITNEIPTYRDPFSYNVWEPYYARTRSIGGMRMSPRFRNRPVYGRVVHKVPPLRVQDVVERNRAFEEVARLYGTVQRGEAPRRRMTAFRLSGGSHMPHMGMTPQAGSFQHLKELIRTERARELQEQRMAEEVAARAAALKDISSGHHDRHRQQNLRDSLSYAYDLNNGARDEQMESLASRGSTGVLAFPDLLAPAARADGGDAALVAEQPYEEDDDYMYREGLKSYQRAAAAPRRNVYANSAYSDDLDSGLIL